MINCDDCINFRDRLITILRNDMSIDFYTWYSSWMEALDNIEFMKEFFMNKTMITRVPYDVKFDIKKHIKNTHDIKLGGI